jgi:predicted SprT family Zn-dependent metalloprotease
MSPLYFLDTNILLYSISGCPAEALKRDRAVDLLERTTERYRCRRCRNSMQRRPDLRGLTRYPMTSPLV